MGAVALVGECIKDLASGAGGQLNSLVFCADEVSSAIPRNLDSIARCLTDVFDWEIIKQSVSICGGVNVWKRLDKDHQII